MDDVDRPPRKKKELFSGGKNVLKSLIRRKKVCEAAAAASSSSKQGLNELASRSCQNDQGKGSVPNASSSKHAVFVTGLIQRQPQTTNSNNNNSDANEYRLRTSSDEDNNPAQEASTTTTGLTHHHTAKNRNADEAQVNQSFSTNSDVNPPSREYGRDTTFHTQHRRDCQNPPESRSRSTGTKKYREVTSGDDDDDDDDDDMGWQERDGICGELSITHRDRFKSSFPPPTAESEGKGKEKNTLCNDPNRKEKNCGQVVVRSQKPARLNAPRQDSLPWHEAKWPGHINDDVASSSCHDDGSDQATGGGVCGLSGPNVEHRGCNHQRPQQNNSNQILSSSKPHIDRLKTSSTTTTTTTMDKHKNSSGDGSEKLLPLTQPALQVSSQTVNENGMIDLDRDQQGSLLPPNLRQFPNQRSEHRQHDRQTVPEVPDTPANLYTSPKRIDRAVAMSSSHLKRKRSDSDLPPPAYIYIHTNDPNFNIFANGFLLYPELCLALASQLRLNDLISLYSISQDFHTIIDSRFTTVCLRQALRKAPQSARAFPFRTYAQYCRTDPAARVPHPNPAKAVLQIPRMIPSFRWVAFVLHREKVIHELLTIFAERGCPLPARCSLALKRMWFIIDMPDNARRIAAIHNHHLITDLDLYFLMCFFVKLDMLANDPVAAEKRDGLRKTLLAQPGGFDTMLWVLKRNTWQKKSDFLVAWVKNSMSLERMDQNQLNAAGVHDVFGVPRAEVGRGKYEYWGRNRTQGSGTGQGRHYLLRPDQLVMREVIRRGLKFSGHFFRCILYGYVRPDNLENYAPREYGRRIEAWRGEDYDFSGSVGGARALAAEDGGDVLLDLGDISRGSKHTVVKEDVFVEERLMRANQVTFVNELYEISARESRGMEAEDSNRMDFAFRGTH